MQNWLQKVIAVPSMQLAYVAEEMFSDFASASVARFARAATKL
jgi:hypothetical protein